MLPALVYGLHLVALHYIITPTAHVYVNPGSVSAATLRMSNSLSRPELVSMRLTGTEGTLEKSEPLHHPACADLSRLAWACGCRESRRERNLRSNFCF